MWPYGNRSKAKVEKPKFESGDTVRIWTVAQHPVGRIHEAIEEKGVILYVVGYEYHDGRFFTERFEGIDLTLVERTSRRHCNCGSNSNRHKDWCNKVIYPNGW